jgi:hypothetical protein
MPELPPFCCPIPNGFSPYDWFGFALCPPPCPPLQVALGLLIYIDAGSIYNCDASAAAVGPACPGGLAHLHRLMSAPGFGMAVPTAGQCMCMATISRLDTMASICIQVGPRLAMLQWPQPLSLTGSLPQPCIYGLSPSPGLKLEILRPSMGFESLELGLEALSQP